MLPPSSSLKDYKVIRMIYLSYLGGKRPKITYTPSGAVYFSFKDGIPSRMDKVVISPYGAWIIK